MQFFIKMGVYQLDQRSYRYFLNSMQRGDQPLIQSRVQVSSLLFDLMLNDNNNNNNNDFSQFVNDTKEIVKKCQSAVYHRGALIVPCQRLDNCNWPYQRNTFNSI